MPVFELRYGKPLESCRPAGENHMPVLGGGGAGDLTGLVL